MTDNKKIEAVNKASKEVEEAEATVDNIGELFINALSLAEKSVDQTKTALETALHKAREAETLIRLLRRQVKDLKSKVKELSKSK